MFSFLWKQLEPQVVSVLEAERLAGDFSFFESIPRWAALGKRRENAAASSEKPVKSEPDKANSQISASVRRDNERFTP